MKNDHILLDSMELIDDDLIANAINLMEKGRGVSKTGRIAGITAAAAAAAVIAVTVPLGVQYFADISANTSGSAATETSDTSEPPRDLGCEMVFSRKASSASVDFEMEEFEGVTFTVEKTTDFKRVVASDGSGEIELYCGDFVDSVYLADINGDGLRELCSKIYLNDRPFCSSIVVCDFANGKLYKLSDDSLANYDLYIKGGELCYEIFNEVDGESILFKKLELSDMTFAEKLPESFGEIPSIDTALSLNNAIELLCTYKNDDRQTVVDIDMWEPMPGLEQLKTVFFGEWKLLDGYAMGLDIGERFFIDNSDKDFFMNNCLEFKAFYAPYNSVYVINIDDSYLLWQASDNLGVMYCIPINKSDNTLDLKEFGVCVKLSNTVNEADENYLSIYKLRALSSEYGIDFDLLTKYSLVSTSTDPENYNVFFRDNSTYFTPIYRYGDDDLSFKVTLIGQFWKPTFDLRVKFVRDNEDWVRLVEFDDPADEQKYLGSAEEKLLTTTVGDCTVSLVWSEYDRLQSGMYADHNVIALSPVIRVESNGKIFERALVNSVLSNDRSITGMYLNGKDIILSAVATEEYNLIAIAIPYVSLETGEVSYRASFMGFDEYGVYAVRSEDGTRYEAEVSESFELRLEDNAVSFSDILGAERKFYLEKVFYTNSSKLYYRVSPIG